MQDLTINEELKTLLPPLSNEEFAGLEADILEHGCLSALIVWNDILIDGHHRYEICCKHEIPFFVQNLVFDNLDEAKLWAWKHQECRRNLTPFHRAELAMKLKEAIAAKAKERQRQASIEKAPVPGEPIETRNELAEIAGISSGTMGKVEYITKYADESVKERLRNGGKGTSINREYLRLKNETEEDEAPASPQPKDPNPAKIAAFYADQYSAKFLQDFILALFEKFRSTQGSQTAAYTAYDMFCGCADTKS